MNFFQPLIYFVLGDRDYSQSENRALRVSTIMFIETIFISIIYLPFHYFLAGIELMRISLIVGIAAFGSLILMKMNRTNLSRLFFITLANVGIFFNSKWAGIDSCIHYFFGVSISLPFFMFATSKHKWQILYSVLISILLGIASQFIEFSGIQKLIINQDFLFYYSSLSTIASLVMLAYTTFYFHSFVEKNEKEIEQKNQMIFQSEKMISLGILSSGIAHEINNPLAVLKMGLSQLKKQCSDSSDVKNEALEKLIKMSVNVDRIAKIVQALKTYSRNEEQDPILPICLDQTIEEATSLLTKEFMSNSVELTYEPSNRGIKILGRQGELIQVFVNLIKNAIDAIKDGSSIKWIRITTEIEEQYLHIYFVDSGNGISKDVLEKLFQPFYSTKNIGEGTGLGLFICRNLIEAMGAKLNYKEIDGHTGFSIKILLAK